jgi:hypothetical protein
MTPSHHDSATNKDTHRLIANLESDRTISRHKYKDVESNFNSKKILVITGFGDMDKAHV